MKKFLIIAVILIAVGAVLFVAVMSANNWDFTKIGGGTFETNSHTVTEDFDSILVNTSTADISFLPSEDGVCRVVCYERAKEKHSAEVNDGRLEIELRDERRWYDYISFGFKSPKLTVYLPKSAYKTIEIDESTGDIRLPAGFSFESVDTTLSTGNLHLGASVSGAVVVEGSTGNVSVTGASIGSLDVKISTGDVHLDNLTVTENVSIKVSTGKVQTAGVGCKDLSVRGSTGKVALKDTVSSGTVTVDVSTGDVSLTNTVAERFTLSTDTGDVSFDSSDARNINVITDTGNVKGTLLSPKLFSARTDTGKVRVPSPQGTEPCIIETDTGDISISIKAE